MAAPVAPPTIAAMPIIANTATEMAGSGKIMCATAPKAAPSVAPMNSEGEKMPPDDPEPRLSDRRQKLAAGEQQSRKGAAANPPISTSCTVE